MLKPEENYGKDIHYIAEPSSLPVFRDTLSLRFNSILKEETFLSGIYSMTEKIVML